MKVIFLDFDGVITTAKSQWSLDEEKLELLKQILDATDAKLVISSPWRKNSLEETIEHLSTPSPHYNPKGFPFCDRIVGVTKRLSSMRGRVERGAEIKLWLDEHGPVDKYIILDVNADMLESQKDVFINTHWKTGLSDKFVKLAIELLK